MQTFQRVEWTYVVLKSGFQNTLEPIKPVSTICIVVILFLAFELNPIPTGQGYFYHHMTKPEANRVELLATTYLKATLIKYYLKKIFVVKTPFAK